ncbi:MAG: hypothetical protein MH321_08875 [Leptospiraceae bacterium]|nr:hypothetical protein [Leptospiraceae bacterium]
MDSKSGRLMQVFKMLEYYNFMIIEYYNAHLFITIWVHFLEAKCDFFVAFKQDDLIRLAYDCDYTSILYTIAVLD